MCRANDCIHCIPMYRFRRESVTRKEPLILSGGYEDSIDSMDVLHRDKPTILLHHDATINTVSDDRTENLFKNNRISYSVDFVPNNVQADIMLQSAAQSTSNSSPSSGSSSSPSESSFHRKPRPLSPLRPMLPQSVDSLTPNPPSPIPDIDPLSPTPLGSQDDDDLSNASSGHRISSRISAKHINAQLSDTEIEDKHSALSQSTSSNTTAPSSPSSSTSHRPSRSWRRTKRKRKHQSRRQYERSQRRKRENVQFLQFNNINVHNHFLQFGGGNSAGDQNVAMLQCMMGMLKLHIEQLSIYTERVKGIEDDNELKRIQWTAEDVWNAVRRREDDEERYWRELKRKQNAIANGLVHPDEEDIEEKQSVHRNIDKICNDILKAHSLNQTQQRQDVTNAQMETVNKEQIDRPTPSIDRLSDDHSDDNAPDVINEPVKLHDTTEDDERDSDDRDSDDIDREPMVRKMRKSTFDALESVLSDDEIDEDHGLEVKNRSVDNLETIDEQTEMDLGFEDIYESIVAYECDIKSLCDMILKEISSNERMKEELHSFRASNEDFRNQLTSLQSEYDAVIGDLHEKEYLIDLNDQTQQNLMDVIQEHETAEKRHTEQIETLQREIEALTINDGHNDVLSHRPGDGRNVIAPSLSSSQSMPFLCSVPFEKGNSSQSVPFANGDAVYSSLHLDELALDLNRLKGKGPNGAEPLSQQELSVMVEQLNDKLHGMQSKLRSNEQRLQHQATKQKEKYRMFLDKMSRKDIDTKDLAMSSSSDDVEDGDDGHLKHREQKEEENEARATSEERDSGTESEHIFDIEKEKKRLKDIGYDTKEAQRITSILTYEKCEAFRDTIIGMRRWIKHSKQDMRHLKTKFAENHQFLELKLAKFSDMRDDLDYQRGELYQQKQQLRRYVKETSVRINEEEHSVQIKRLELEQHDKRLATKEEDLKDRETLLEKEKSEFDGMSRRYNQKKIDEELKNAQLFGAKMLEIERKERSVVAQCEQLEITRQYVMKQKEMCAKERELIHQQQQQVFFNEKQLKRQQDAITTDQCYVQQEYIDAKDKFENDRYVLVDKINRLETDNAKFKMDVDSLSKRLSLQTDITSNLEKTIENLKQQLLRQTSENNKMKSSQFGQDQDIANLRNELTLAKARIVKYEADSKANDERNVQQLKQHSSEKRELQNENATLQLEVNSLKDEIDLFKIKYEHNIGAKAKKKKKSKKSSKTAGAKSKKSSIASSRNLRITEEKPKAVRRSKSSLSAVTSSKKVKERAKKSSDVDSKPRLKGKSKSKSRLLK